MFGDIAMWWFNKKERREIWDEPVEEPPGDIEAAQRIRDICRSASDTAECVGASGAQSEKKKKRESERYERAVRAAMTIAMKISDDLMRDASVRDIISLCMKANHLGMARILLRAIQAAPIKSDVLNKYPILRDGGETEMLTPMTVASVHSRRSR